jgi:Mlc titration factor MtfA (ptsG expression regulator)
MPPEFFLVLVGAILLGWLTYFGLRLWRRSQRARLRQQDLPASFVAILEKEVPLYRRMPPDLRAELRGYVNVFLADKEFIGCDGLTITDEIRLVIAGNACVLLLNRGVDYFAGFRSVLVYPGTYMATLRHMEGGIVTESVSTRAGESWHTGPVVLSWTDVRKGIDHPDDGHNVVLHEFAHKLDEENGIVDGLPILREVADYAEWARVLTREFADLVERVRHRKNEVMDGYGATSPPEFFAVATETFFERGGLMQERLPELYQQFRKFYGVDPAAWR